MSRYTKQKDHLTLNYGHDHALGYWYDIQDNSQLDDEGNPKLVDEQCSFINRMNRGFFLEILEKFDANKDHRMKVALDLTF